MFAGWQEESVGKFTPVKYMNFKINEVMKVIFGLPALQAIFHRIFTSGLFCLLAVRSEIKSALGYETGDQL